MSISDNYVICRRRAHISLRSTISYPPHICSSHVYLGHNKGKMETCAAQEHNCPAASYQGTLVDIYEEEEATVLLN
jgi:hypothetical protein